MCEPIISWKEVVIMIFSWSSFFASAIAISFLSAFSCFLLRRNRIVSRFGIICLYIFAILIILRGYLPFEFDNVYGVCFTKTYHSFRILPALRDFVIVDLFYVDGKPIRLREILTAVWIIGIIANMGKLLHSFLLYKKKLKCIPKADSPEVLAAFCKAFSHVFPGKSPHCTVVNTDLFGTAVIWGVRNPIIVLPHIEYNSRELYYVFLHELFHLKHRDNLIKMLCCLLAAVHWWNPLISRFLLSATNQVQELLADYQVVRSLNAMETIDYLECIKKTAVHTISAGADRMSLHTLGNGNKKRNILQRFRLIMEQKAAGYTIKGIALAVLCFFMSFSFVFEPYYNDVYDENGNEVFSYIKSRDDNYYIKNGTTYDLYLNGRYVYTDKIIIDDFKELPIYEGGKK